MLTFHGEFEDERNNLATTQSSNVEGDNRLSHGLQNPDNRKYVDNPVFSVRFL